MKLLLLTLVGAVVLSATLANAAQNPTPFVNQPLIPASVAPGGPDFTLTVNGTGFVSGSTVNWNGSPRATTFVSGSQLTASILSTDIATATTGSVTVSSPAPGGGVSNVVFLPVRNPASFVSLNAESFGISHGAGVLAAGDFNKDGNQDIAAVTFDTNPTVRILIGNGDGSFTQESEYPLPSTSPASISTADVDQDGNLDLVLADATARLIVLLGNGDGSFRGPSEYPATTHIYGTAIGDYNRDGIPDVAAVWQNGFRIILGTGGGVFGTGTCLNVPIPDYFGIATGDFNADGKLDLVLTSNTGSVAIELGNGDGTFASGQFTRVQGNLISPVAADFNQDGKLDLVAADMANNRALVLLGKGDGTFHSPTFFPTPLGPSLIFCADMNGDGKLDLVVGDNGLSVASVAVLLGNGDGTFQNYTAFDGSSLAFLAAADFNNDGRLDVAVTNQAFPTITILTQDDGTVVSLSKNALTFPTQLVNSVSGPRFITLTNTGTDPIKISRVNITSNFSQLNNCNRVQPGKSCRIGVFFTPSTSGDLIGYMTIFDDGGGSPQIITLSGTATVVSLSPSKLDFGGVPVGKFSTPQDVLLTNEGNSVLNITRVGIGGHDFTDFFQVNACPNTLPSGASCTITVFFHPTAPGDRRAILGVIDDGGGSPQKVPLTGTGT